jgi:transposase
VLSVSVWRATLGVDAKTVVEAVDYDEDADAIVASVRPRRATKRRCGRCGVRAAGYDRGEGRRRWRALDVGPTRCYLEADPVRVTCPVHGVVAAQVPWAGHGARHTTAFEVLVAWLVVRMNKSAVKELLRVSWDTVGAVVDRVVARDRARVDPFDGLVRIGIDEISYKKGHRYLMVVVDHGSGRLVWAKAGHDRATLRCFFDAVGQERCRKIRLVSCDAAEWIAEETRVNCPGVIVCIDPFHVTQWATDALDVVRRQTWNDARKQGMTAQARQLKGARFALWRNPEDLTSRQQAKLSWIKTANKPLYRAYLLKEQLRQVIHVKDPTAIDMLKAWCSWASRSRLPAFVELARRIRKHLPGILNALLNRLSNGLVESTNTKIRVLTRIAYGFTNTDHLIALALLDRGGHCPPSPRQ